MTDKSYASDQSGGGAAADGDSAYLRSLGVEPRLQRALGFFTGSLFAIAFQGPTTGALLVTGATVAIGGPAFIWAIPLIFLFQLVLALLWAELSSHYPLTGGIYQWAKRLGGEFVGWMTGLFYIVAIILVMPAVGLVMNAVFAGLFPGTFKDTETTQIIFAICTTLVAALVMSTSVRLVALLNSIGVVLELVVLLGAAVALLANRQQGLGILTQTGGAQGDGSYLTPFLIVVALVVTQLVGFETAGAFAEETKDSRIKPSQAIIAGLSGTALVLFIFDFCLLLAVPSAQGAMTSPSLIPVVLTAAVGSWFAKLFLVGAGVAVFSTGIATLATIVRTVYGMARNQQLPGSAFLTKLSPSSDEPVGAIVVSALLAMIPLLFIKHIEVLVAAITALIIVPYILVLVSLLRHRLQGWPRQEAQFRLGSWGLPLTVIGLVWTVCILLDAIWPRAATNPDLGPLPVIWELGLGVIVVGVLWWLLVLRGRVSAPMPAPDAVTP